MSPYTRGVDRLPRRDALVLLAVLGTGVFLAGLELMITAVALPAIVTDLATWNRLREASWIINGYLLVYVVTMPLAGRLADLWGNRRLFLAALVMFTIGSLLAGAAPTLETLIAARLVQAAGGGALVPVEAIGSLSESGAPTSAASGITTSASLRSGFSVASRRASPLTTSKRGWWQTPAKLVCRNMKLSSTVTPWPACRNIGTITAPRYPAPPVTKILQPSAMVVLASA